VNPGDVNLRGSSVFINVSSERLCKGKCGKTLPATEEYFYFRKSSRNGKYYPSPYCRICEKDKSSTLRKNKYATEDGKKTIDLQNKTYRQKPEKKKAISDHLKWMYENDLEYRAERKANALAWKAANRGRNIENKARWYQESKARLREEWNERFRTDPIFRLRNNLRRSIWEALRSGGGCKGGRSILKHLPYSMEELKVHIESLWEPWMNWDNYGVIELERRTWQIDHITPQVHLPFSDFSDPNFLLCWALSNLRPIDARLNIEKGCRM
jgi:hypothetical protein